ncbi:MAG: VanZ family protein [Deltaproteobacteria bacterium]|nr:VanZ family protein [Deltaproteobacteria bacterium]MDL2121478.1 VanZ family protein [Deltaproteobacteria bacterium]
MILSVSMPTLPNWTQWTAVAGHSSLYGAASLKNMLQKIRHVKHYLGRDGRLPDGDINLSGSKKFIYHWLPVIIYCLLIFIQSSYPSPENIPNLPYLDKLIHFAAYAILGILFFRAFRTQRFKENINLVIMLSILSSSLYGMSDEVHQYFVPYRNADIMDFLADVMGSICGVYLLMHLTGMKRMKFFE